MYLSGPVVIAGFMGCGKTSVARCLAAQLKTAIVDLDEAITERTGRSPAQLISEDGEQTFRPIETRVLEESLSYVLPRVISLGGGAWIETTNRELISAANSKTFWLDAPFELCWQRIIDSGDDRPLGKSEEQARKLFERRRPVYELDTVRISISAADTPEEIATRIAATLTDHLTY